MEPLEAPVLKAKEPHTVLVTKPGCASTPKTGGEKHTPPNLRPANR